MRFKYLYLILANNWFDASYFRVRTSEWQTTHESIARWATHRIVIDCRSTASIFHLPLYYSHFNLLITFSPRSTIFARTNVASKEPMDRQHAHSLRSKFHRFAHKTCLLVIGSILIWRWIRYTKSKSISTSLVLYLYLFFICHLFIAGSFHIILNVFAFTPFILYFINEF